MRLHRLIASCKSCARCFWGQMPNLNPVQWSKTFVGQFERFARPARYFYFRILWRWKKTSTIERESSKTKKNHQKLITKSKRKAPYLARYTKIGKVIKRFDSELNWPLSMTICPKTFWACFFHHPKSVYKVGRRTDQVVFRYPVRNKCTQKVAGRLTFDLLTQSSMCNSRF